MTLENGQRTQHVPLQALPRELRQRRVRMTVDGKTYNAAKPGQPVGYEIRPGKRPGGSRIRARRGSAPL